MVSVGLGKKMLGSMSAMGGNRSFAASVASGRSADEQDARHVFQIYAIVDMQRDLIR
jgi:hypothetical protein